MTNLPLALMTVYNFATIYNRKYNAYNVDVKAVEINVQPLGGDGREFGGIYPVTFVEKQTAEKVYVKYTGTGMGDGPFKQEWFTTPEAARKAALVWLGDATEMTEEQKKNVDKAVNVKELAKMRKFLREYAEDYAKRVEILTKKIRKMEAVAAE